MPLHAPIHSTHKQVYSDTLRGELVLNFIQSLVPNIEKKTVLDLGCGSGIISVPFSQRTTTLGLDSQIENLRYVKSRSNELYDLRLVCADVKSLPIKALSFDVVIVNGLLEWVGQGTNSPRQRQLNFLQDVRMLLKNGGILYIGIENRLFWRYLIRDPHSHTLLVNLLPKKIARTCSRLILGRVFDAYIYTIWGYRRMLSESGFSLSAYIPLINYQFPFRIVEFDDKRILEESRELIANIDNYSEEFVELIKPLSTRLNCLKYSILKKLGVLRFCMPSFVLVAKKNADE